MSKRLSCAVASPSRSIRSAFEPLEPRLLLAANDPLYVITHGADISGANAETWMVDMALAIADRTGHATTAEHMERAVYDWNAINPDVPSTTAARDADVENFVIFSWDDESGLLDPGDANDDDVSGHLTAVIQQHLSAETPRDVHLIGHSRGAYVVADVARRLGEDPRIGFLQLTTLDPQAYLTDGSLKTTPSNVDWHDNYYQTQDTLEGFSVAHKVVGGFNLDLTEVTTAWTPERGGRDDRELLHPTTYTRSPDHSEVRDWYYWTIDQSDGSTTKPRETQQLAVVDPADPSSVKITAFETRQFLYGGLNLDLDLDGKPDNLGGGKGVGFHFSRGDALGRRSFAGFGGLDLVFVIDTTGSMADDIAKVKESAAKIVDEVKGVVPSFRIGIVDYRDHPGAGGDAGDYPSRTVLAMTSDTAAILAGINSLTVAGGGDLPESVYSGVNHAISMKDGLGQWRGGDNRKVVLLFGDAAPHEPEAVTGYTKYQVATAAYNADPVDVFGVVVGDDADAVAAFDTVSAASGGRLLRAATADDVVGAVLEAVTAIVDAGNSGIDDNGVLRVFGTGGDDTVEIGVDGTDLRVTLNGTVSTFDLAGVKATFVEARGGNDTVRILPGAPFALLIGGAGNDTLTGGDARDALFGGDGDDVLVGGAGGDFLDGGNGRDHLDGQGGDDTLQGGLGDDLLVGGRGVDAASYLDRDGGVGVFLNPDDGVSGAAGEADLLRDLEQALGGSGDDVLVGDAGPNYLFGLAGDDTLRGGDGRDTLEGGAGSDELDGGAEADLLVSLTRFADPGRDRLFGGGGLDVAVADADDETDLVQSVFGSFDDFLAVA